MDYMDLAVCCSRKAVKLNHSLFALIVDLVQKTTIRPVSQMWTLLAACRELAVDYDTSVGRMVRYYFALAYKMVKMSKSAFLLKMEVSQSGNLS